MWGLPQKQNARRAYKIRLCGHLRRYKKIVKKTYMILYKQLKYIEWWQKKCKIKRKQRLVEREHTYGEKVYDWCNDRKCKFTAYDESDAGL